MIDGCCPHDRAPGAVCLDCGGTAVVLEEPDWHENLLSRTIREWDERGLRFSDIGYDPKAQEQAKSSYQDNEFAGQPKRPMTASEVLLAANAAIADRARLRDHEGERSMALTVGVFQRITNTELSERDGWLFMAIVKLARSQQGNFHVDDYIDAAAYIALAAEAAK